MTPSGERHFEERWVLSACGLAPPFRPRGNATEPDWGRVAELAKQQHLSPLIYWNLRIDEENDRGAGRRRAHPLPPSPILSRFESHYHQSLHRSVQLEGEFERLCRVLGDHRISFIPLKGIALSRQVYPDPALRPMGDIDILLKPEQLDRASRILSKEGYSPDTVRFPGPWTPETHHLCPWRHDGTGTLLETHTHLLESDSPQRDSPGGLWERSIGGRWSSIEIRVLSPEDSILYTACHLLTHRSLRLLILIDLMRSLRAWREKMDPTRIALLSSSTVMGGIAGVALKRFDIVIPPAPPTESGPDRGLTLAGNALGMTCRLLEGGSLPPAQTPFTAGAAMSNTQAAYWQSLGGLPSRSLFLLRYTIRLLFPPPGWMRRRYRVSRPPLDILILYPRRMIDLLVNFLKRLYGEIGSKNRSGI